MENNIGSLLLEAANLLVVGMTVVFLFLGLLIFCVKLMSKVIGTEAPVVANAPSNRASSRPAKVKDDKVVAAITAAVHQYRQDNKQ